MFLSGFYRFRRYALALTLGLAGLGILPEPGPAIPFTPTAPPPPATTRELTDPLNPARFPVDPLVPASVPLTPFQRRRLREALDQLNQDAQAQWNAGNQEAALEIWYRELRARRKLSTLEEINALGRVGGIVWEKSRKEDVLAISNRLEAIKREQEQKKALTPEILTALATAYQQIRSLDESIALYQELRRQAQQRQDIKAENQALGMLGELYLAKFDYPKAAEIYELLLSRAQASKNTYAEGIFLQKLAMIYSKASEADNAIRIKEALLNRYVNNQKIELVPDLKIAIADDYNRLNQAEKASKNYQEAYTLAWSLRQYGVASLALKKLGDLYLSNGQANYALQIYQQLLRVEQQSYNYYGLMQTYEIIAQLYRNAKQYPPAITATEQALSLARSLKYQDREEALLGQLQTLTQEMQPTTQP
ncbi:hypothetical protein [Synechocystis sp. LKSZ1]|uniref:tetratricopeptide repeat protein n=1 Tax=Synechocystis sp. LKSZ1 TaxID=3144951 RepID=UPI00336BEEBA